MDPPTPSCACLRCGYDLTGLDARRPCPECGLLAGLSLMDNPELRHNRPRWLASLALGSGLVALGALVAPLLPTSLLLLSQRTFVTNAAGQARLTVNWPLWAAGLAIAMASTLPIVSGIWLLCGRSGREADDRATLPVRVILRMVALAPPAVALAWAVRGPRVMAANINTPQIFWSLTAFILAFAVLAGLLFLHLRGLARRAPAPRLAADSPVVGLVLAGCLLFSFVLGAIGERYPDQFPRGTEGSAMYVVFAVWLAVSAAAFIWAIYLLMRYTAAFWRSMVQSRELMRRFDAAAQDQR
jgi:hypothetical protein